MYTAWLTFEDSFKDVYFPDQKNWISRIVLRQDETGEDRDLYLSMRVLDGRLYVDPVAPLCWRNGSFKEQEVKGDVLFIMKNADNGHEVSIMVKQCEREWLAFTKYRLSGRPILIGRSQKAHIRDTNMLMTSEHGILGLTKEGFVRYQDQSSNGTYLNGRKLLGAAVRLQFGDVLAYPTGLKIIFLGDCIAVNRTSSTQDVHLEKWHMPPEKARVELDPEDRRIPDVFVEYQRAPRMLKKIEAEDVDIEGPIPKEAGNKQPLILQLGPSMTMVLPMLMGTVVAGRGMLSGGVIMIGTSSVLAVMWGLINRNYRKRQEIEVEERRISMYQQYIAETEEMLRSMNEGEFQRLTETFPNAAQCAQMPVQRSRNLWNRMPTHPDFLHVRVGTGDVNMPCEITIPKEKLSVIDDELRNEPARLRDSYNVINHAPVTIPLREEAVIGILGGTRATLFAQGLLVQIATLHSYHDVRIAVLTDESSASQWSWTRWLPHVFASEDRELRMVASNASDVHEIAAHLDEVLSIRKSSASENNGDDNTDVDKEARPLPHYVIFCTNYRILESELVMRSLLTNRYGMTLVMIGEDMTHLPKECHYVFNIQHSEGYLHASEGDTQQVDFEYPDRGLIKSFSRSMAILRVRDVAENAAIPTLVSFLDIYNVRKVDDLEVWRMWTENHTYDGLKSTIGYRAGSQPFILDISDKYHGPHGLIAGTTGSGKSVMLETYILSLALNYSPRQIQFILIDYKGGGMADSFRDLPHVAGIIDNLQGERVIDRALASLEGEIHRRELVFKSAKVNKIDDYTRLYGDEPGMEMPHLIIIVDEFAELKSEQPEFMSKLVSASRVGRSLGIHLILATQKPSNSVSDEIWANSRFHLCLRVQTRQDSMEMLKRPDAAYIKGMGRCFIQIGNDELFEEVQTSYSGLAYRPDELRAEEIPQLLTGIGHVVHVPRKKKDKNAAKEKEETQMSAVLERIHKVAVEHNLDKQHRLWQPELSGSISLNEIEDFKKAAKDDKNWPNPAGEILFVAGMADDVANQRYLPFIINLSASRNLLIAGLTGSGKTTAVQTMVYSLCSMYDPDHLSIYILSLTSQTLGNLNNFPQVADIVFDGEEVEMRRFLNMIFDEMQRRAELFAASSTDSFIEFNNARIAEGQQPEPAIVVFIDRFMQLRELFANDDFYYARIQTLLQEGSGRGIHFVLTAMAKNEIPAKLHPFMAGVALQQKERGDYSDVIGKRVPYEMPPIATMPGRGMGVLDGKVYELQFALGGAAPQHLGEGFESLKKEEKKEVVEESTDVARAKQIITYARANNETWKGTRSRKIPRIPKDPTWEVMFAENEYASTKQNKFTIPVGYHMVSGQLATINTEEAPSWLVYGPQRSGISNFLKLMARVMVDRGADVYVIADTAWTVLANELNIPLYTTPDAVRDFLLGDFVEKYAKPRKPLHEAAAQQGRAAQRKQAAEFKPVCIIVDNAQWLYNTFSQEPYKEKLPHVQGLLGEIIEKMYYNFTIFMGVSARERMSMSNEPLKRIGAQGRGIALGGKVSEFDPCGVGGGLNTRARGAALPIGQGYVGHNGETFQLVVPLAEIEEH